jgi:hypothetical protein
LPTAIPVTDSARRTELPIARARSLLGIASS